MSTAIVLPYDPEGTNPECRRENEQHVVSPPAQIKDQSVIVPRLAPFHANETMVVSVGTAENKVPLTHGVDYQFVYRHHAASKATGTDIYGGILFTSRAFNGNVWLDYQSIGGMLTLDDLTIVERFSRSIHNVMWASWEQFVGLPSAWPIADHAVDGMQLFGMEQLGASMDRVAAAINAKNSGAGSEPIANAHITATNAHTPSQVGLANINNWPVATANDFNVGTNNAYATAYGVKTYLDSRLSGLAVGELANRITAVEDKQGEDTLVLNAVQQALTNMGNSFNDIEQDMESVNILVNQQNIAIQNVTDATGALSSDVAANTTKVGQHTAQISTANTKIGQLEAKDTAFEGAISGLEAANNVRNPLGVVPNGTHIIMLAPNAQLNVAMVAYGGKGGNVVDDLVQFHQPRSHIGQAKIYLCTDIADGTTLTEPLTLVNVKAGGDGHYTLASSTNFGGGGVKGTATVAVHAILKDVTSGDGAVGGDGTSDGAVVPVGGIGYAVGGVTYGVGSDGEADVAVGSAGAGGSGGWAEFKLKNESTHNLKLILVTDVSPDDRTGTNAGIVKIT